MSEHLEIPELHLKGLRNLCVVKDGEPPFNFDSLHVPAGAAFQSLVPTRDAGHDYTYWGPK